ncbi:MAG: carboxypeptidase-like regulatory domain-containing protein [Pyrinomonadaceae bacterium]
MRVFRNTLLIIIFITALAGVEASLAQTSPAKQQSTGIMKGLVVDPTDARIAYGRIVVESKKLNQKVKANESGEYEIILPVGEYEVFAEMDGFHSSPRKKLCVVKNKTIEYNVTLEGIRNDVDHP